MDTAAQLAGWLAVRGRDAERLYRAPQPRPSINIHLPSSNQTPARIEGGLVRNMYANFGRLKAR